MLVVLELMHMVVIVMLCQSDVINTVALRCIQELLGESDVVSNGEQEKESIIRVRVG